MPQVFTKYPSWLFINKSIGYSLLCLGRLLHKYPSYSLNLQSTYYNYALGIYYMSWVFTKPLSIFICPKYLINIPWLFIKSPEYISYIQGIY